MKALKLAMEIMILLVSCFIITLYLSCNPGAIPLGVENVVNVARRLNLPAQSSPPLTFCPPSTHCHTHHKHNLFSSA